MGLNQGSGFKYLNVSCGQFVSKKNGVVDKSGYSFVGKIIDIRAKTDTFEGKEIKKIEIIFEDGDEKTCIQFGEKTWYSQGFFARIEKIDFTKPIELGCSQSDQNEKMSFCWIKQGNEIVKKDPDYPRPDKVVVSGENMSDWTKFLDRSAKSLIVVGDILQANAPAPNPDPESAPADSRFKDDDDLPF